MATENKMLSESTLQAGTMEVLQDGPSAQVAHQRLRLIPQVPTTPRGHKLFLE